MEKLNNGSIGSAADVTSMTASITAAYLGANPVRPDEIPGIIKAVHGALAGLGQPEASPAEAPRQAPAVPIRKSVAPDYIVCLEDGKRMKMLKRYLRTTYNMSPEEYRAKWGLPADYPMTAPNYAARRSEFAKQFGLGRRSARAAADATDTAQAA